MTGLCIQTMRIARFFDRSYWEPDGVKYHTVVDFKHGMVRSIYLSAVGFAIFAVTSLFQDDGAQWVVWLEYRLLFNEIRHHFHGIVMLTFVNNYEETDTSFRAAKHARSSQKNEQSIPSHTANILRVLRYGSTSLVDKMTTTLNTPAILLSVRDAVW